MSDCKVAHMPAVSACIPDSLLWQWYVAFSALKHEVMHVQRCITTCVMQGALGLVAEYDMYGAKLGSSEIIVAPVCLAYSKDGSLLIAVLKVCALASELFQRCITPPISSTVKRQDCPQ